MIKIEKLQPGMIVYDLHKHKMGNTVVMTWSVWKVEIIEVDVPNLKVVASWNGNPPQNYYGSSFKWRKNKPLMIKTWGGGGQRPATREELAAHKGRH